MVPMEAGIVDEIAFAKSSGMFLFLSCIELVVASNYSPITIRILKKASKVTAQIYP